MTDGAIAAPSAWIARFAPLIPPGARVLDLACGQGRHSRFLAARLCDVVAVDRDAQALAALAGVPRVTTIAADLEGGPWPLSGQRFDAIVVANYLYRPLFPQLLDALNGSGTFLYETFAAGNEVYGRPSNPDHLLAVDELLSLLRERLTIVAFEQGRVDGAHPAVVQRIAAVGSGRPWPPLLPLLPPEAAAAQDVGSR
jgi:SAM-dependent methyltransferase